MVQTSASRLPTSLLALDACLDERSRNITKLVGRLHVVNGAHIRRLYFAIENENERNKALQASRRTLLRLTKLGVLTRLERRVGGINGGSDGYCYRLNGTGQRLERLWLGLPDRRGWSRPDPGDHFVRHTLAVSELYVRLCEAARQSGGRLEVLGFDAEPASWRDFVGLGGLRQTLKPDIFVRLATPENELFWFVEVDLGTIGRRARSAQATAYRDYLRSGADGEVMPRVCWLSPNSLVQTRVEVAIQPSARPYGLFVAITYDQAIEALQDPGRRGPA